VKVVVPFTSLSPETSYALFDAREDYTGSYVGTDDEAYFRLLERLWTAGEDFAIVEQDIVVEPDTLESFRACPHSWCCAPYPYLKGVYSGLGCVRFRSELMRRLPDLMERVAIRANELHPPKHWCTLDAWVQRTMAAAYSQRPCQRHKPVGHLHRRPTHGCVPERYLPDED
jgi:hypothetical protein